MPFLRFFCPFIAIRLRCLVLPPFALPFVCGLYIIVRCSFRIHNTCTEAMLWAQNEKGVGRSWDFSECMVQTPHFQKKEKKEKNDFKGLLSVYFPFGYINVPKSNLKRNLGHFCAKYGILC